MIMTLNQGLNFVVAAVLFLFGVACLFAPTQIARLLHHELPTSRGVAEFRIANAGLFIALGVGLMLFRDATAFRLIALAWFGLFITRLIAVVVDRPKITADFVGLGLVELTFGLFSLA
jgi:hypothetical protein